MSRVDRESASALNTLNRSVPRRRRFLLIRAEIAGVREWAKVDPLQISVNGRLTSDSVMPFHTSTLNPSSTSHAAWPPRMPQFSAVISRKRIFT